MNEPRTSGSGTEAICPECGRHVRHAYRDAPAEVIVPGDPNCRALLVSVDWSEPLHKDEKLLAANVDQFLPKNWKDL